MSPCLPGFLSSTSPMRIDVISIFGEAVEEFCAHALLGKAQQSGLVTLNTWDPRDDTSDVHRSVDDAPFGGGAGMVMRPEPLAATVDRVDPPRPILVLSASGRRFDQSYAAELSGLEGFTLVCGRYEGIDQRFIDQCCDGELSLGDFVLNGGEAAAVCVIESVVRLLPGMMGNSDSAVEESYTSGLLEYPQYTRPAEFRGEVVPEVLRSGDHARVERWRRAMALQRTIERRPDLVEARGGLSEGDRQVLQEFS